MNIIEKEFVSVCVEGQNILGSVEGMKKFLQMIEEPLKSEVELHWDKLNTSLERWEVLKELFNTFQSQVYIPIFFCLDKSHICIKNKKKNLIKY